MVRGKKRQTFRYARILPKRSILYGNNKRKINTGMENEAHNSSSRDVKNPPELQQRFAMGKHGKPSHNNDDAHAILRIRPKISI